ncbi:MAG TPA: ankyrin repeat domain-containing protein [Pseudonocardiaceae bacterium]
MGPLRHDEEPAMTVATAIRTGDLDTLRRLLGEHPGLATARIGDGRCERTLLHVATDWPGHRPRVAATIGLLVGAGADVDAPLIGPHRETALHWAASSDDVAAVDALLDAGADIEAPGAVIAGGTPLADATAFGQWRAAARLVERGATADLFAAAALGLMDRLGELLGATPPPAREEITGCFWGACHGGRLAAARLLLAAGADLNWIGWDHLTPLDAARRAQASELAAWLLARGALTAAEAARPAT